MLFLVKFTYYIFLQQSQVTPENKTQGTYILPNIHYKKEIN